MDVRTKTKRNVKGVRKRLLASPAVQSLAAETELTRTLVRAGWRAHQSVYYQDMRSGKIREVDIVASSVCFRTVTHGDQNVAVDLVIEAKTMRDFHIVFALQRGAAVPRTGVQTQWLGYRDEPPEQLVGSIGLGPAHVTAVARRLKKIAFPSNFMRVGTLSINPPLAPVEATAFRETNIGSDRELESSVLWRGIQSVASAIDSDIERIRANDIHDLKVAVESAEGDAKRAVEYVVAQLTSQLNSLDVFHPIVVLEAPLWVLDSNRLKPVTWCRLHWNAGGYSERWVDVVSRKEFGSFLERITRHYDGRLRMARATSSLTRRWSRRRSRK